MLSRDILFPRMLMLNCPHTEGDLDPLIPHVEGLILQASQSPEKVLLTTPLLPPKWSLKFHLSFHCVLWMISPCNVGSVPSRLYRPKSPDFLVFCSLLKKVQTPSPFTVYGLSPFWGPILAHGRTHTHFHLHYGQAHPAPNRLLVFVPHNRGVWVEVV